VIYRYMIEDFSRTDDEHVNERLRELGLESWELVNVLAGRRADSDDKTHFTGFFRRDASTDIGL